MCAEQSKNFGGPWSDKKLGALRAYLSAYMTAMKKTPFKLGYIDAFAGAGLREVEESEGDWFEDKLSSEEIQSYRHGSPLIALSHDPAFDTYIFIEKDETSIASLKAQVESMSESAGKDIRYLQGDANEQLQALTNGNWKGNRAVAFLDPFALEVNWETIERIGQTQSIDMWLLFPAMAVNRMLPKSGQIPEQWVARLDKLFGENNWREVFYAKSQPDLFGEDYVIKVPQIFQSLSDYVTDRLGTVFAGTHKTPLVLRNSSGAPLFLLCFASGNPKGARIATRIAQHIINSSSHG